LPDQVEEDRRDSGIIQAVEDAVEVRHVPDVPVSVGFLQVAHEPTRRKRAVDLVHGREKGIGERDALASGLRGRKVRDVPAEVG